MFQPCHCRPCHFQPRRAHAMRFALRLLFLLVMLGLTSAVTAQVETAPAATSTSSQNPLPEKSHQQGFFVPFTPVPGQGAPMITIRLNDRQDATFVVDTGTDVCIISRSLADRLGLKTFPFLLPNGRTMLRDGKLLLAVTLTSLQIGGKSGPLIIRSSNVKTVVMADQQLRVSADRLIDGVVGLNLIHDFAVLFDFPGRMMTLCTPGNLTPGEARYLGFNEAGGTVLPLSSIAVNLFSVPVRLENGKVSRQADLIVDTGAQRTEIPHSVAQDLSLIPLRRQPVAGLAGNYSANEAQVYRLGLGSLQIAEPLVMYSAPIDHATGLGLDILSGYKVLLDFPARKMYLQPTVPSINIKPTETAKPAGTKTAAP